MLLKDRVCIITGAASARGIGKATARVFAAQGARIAILDLDAAQAEEAARDIGSDHLGLACNVTDKAACQAAADAVMARFGRIDVLVNNAGITQPLRIMEIGPEHYDAVTDVNLRGTLYMSQAVIPECGRSEAAPSSASPRSRRNGAAASSAGLTTARRRAVCSGFRKRWPRTRPRQRAGELRHPRPDPDRHYRDKLTPELKAEIVRGIPLGRLGVADDVAKACLFLASDLSAYITGAVIDVNGGMLIH